MRQSLVSTVVSLFTAHFFPRSYTVPHELNLIFNGQGELNRINISSLSDSTRDVIFEAKNLISFDQVAEEKQRERELATQEKQKEIQQSLAESRFKNCILFMNYILFIGYTFHVA